MQSRPDAAETEARAERTAKLAVFIAGFALVVACIIFFGLTRNMTGLVDALQEETARRVALEERVQLLESQMEGR